MRLRPALVILTLIGLLALVACKGAADNPGQTGDLGSQEVQGDQGPQGSLGIGGSRGFPGFAGSRGPEGLTGEPPPDFGDFIGDTQEAVNFVDMVFSLGSGVRISPTEVITAEHAITGAGRVDVSVEGDTYQRVKGPRSRDTTLTAIWRYSPWTTRSRA